MTRKRNRGFTLVELLLVMVILAILAAVVIPKMVGRGEQAKETKAKTDISNIGSALDMFEVDTGSYPSNEQGLQALVTNPGAQGWKGPYLQHSPMDPWGNAYIYKSPGTNNVNGYDLYSTGKDGKDTSGNAFNNWSNPSANGTSTASGS